MRSERKIPIKNIYYMLCYASGELPRNGDAVCGSEPFEHIYDLIARVLILSVTQLLRRGFYRDYVTAEASLSTLRGRIDIQKSIHQQTAIKKQLICCYDEMSADVALNQIIKSAMTVLLQHSHLKKEYRLELEKLRRHFSHISDIRPNAQLFSSLRLSRSSRHYLLTIHVCQLLFEHLITNEKNGTVRFAEFLEEKQMSTLYEKFVLNFFLLHLPRKTFDVRSSKIKWILDEGVERHIPYLPEMRTDIVLTNKQSQVQLIIDTKFYTDTLAEGYFSKEKIIHPENLYQMFAYLSNSRFTGNIIGLLLYPTVTAELDFEIPIRKKHILVKTLNLNADWDSIEQQLLQIPLHTNLFQA